MPSNVIIVGDLGQDGSLLKANLIKKGYRVVGLNRNGINCSDSGMQLSLMQASLLDEGAVNLLVKNIQPAQIYYLAAHHSSSEQAGESASLSAYQPFHDTHVSGLINFLCAIVQHSPSCRLFYASSSLIFDGTHGPLQNENTPLTPTGYYGLTKSQGMLVCREFRKSHSVFASTGILYNHESHLRGDKFLSKKLILAARSIASGSADSITLGNLLARTDWGYAKDYVDAFQRILRINEPGDFVVATGETHSVAEFAEIVFNCFGLDYRRHVKEDSSMLSRTIPIKIGDSSKLRSMTGWQPTVSFSEMVETLVYEFLGNESGTNWKYHQRIK